MHAPRRIKSKKNAKNYLVKNELICCFILIYSTNELQIAVLGE